jgi:hypothetical protein
MLHKSICAIIDPVAVIDGAGMSPWGNMYLPNMTNETGLPTERTGILATFQPAVPDPSGGYGGVGRAK